MALALVATGVFIGLIPIMGQIYTNYQEHRMMDEWLNSDDAAAVEENTGIGPEEGYVRLQEVLAPDGGEPKAAAEAAEARTEAQPAPVPAAEPERPETAAEPEKPLAGQKVLGIIKIDKIKVKAPLVEGVKASNLKAGIGHIPGTAAPGSPGNSALAGHRSYTFGKFFNRLDELEVGDDILILTKEEELGYKVYEKRVVKPDDVSVLKGSKDKSIITLITCTPVYIASHRLIVHAELEERIPK